MDIKELMLKKTEIFRQEIRRREVRGVLSMRREHITQVNSTLQVHDAQVLESQDIEVLKKYI